MNSDKIYTGTIKKCTIYEKGPGYYSSTSKVHKDDAILVKSKNKKFVDAANLNLLKIICLYIGIDCGKSFMNKHAYGAYQGELFVDATIRYNLEDNKISLLKLKKECNKK